jgi:outer membrane protein OmpA-like peptidoglycan-associated protein
MWDGKNHACERRSSWGVLLLSFALSACSAIDSAVDTINPFSSSKPRAEGEFPKVSSVPNAPQANSASERREIVRGLVADRENARYSDEAVRREGNPTRPLAPPPAAQPTAQAPAAAPPAPAAIAAAPPRGAMPPAASVPVRGAVSAAPVQEPPMAPPPPYEPSAVPAARAASAGAAPQAAPASSAAGRIQSGTATVMDYYQQRLAESAQQQTGAIPRSEFTGAPLGQPVAGPAPTLIPPPGYPQAPQMANTAPMAPAGSLPLARVGFATGSVKLSAADIGSLREVARVQRQHGGRVRVVGASADESPSRDPVRQMVDNLDLALKRANAVSGELTRLGVPARSLVVETAPAGQMVASAAPRTEVFIEY